jgi:hypothetical protein
MTRVASLALGIALALAAASIYPAREFVEAGGLINLPAARALGVKLPTSLTARADELLR